MNSYNKKALAYRAGIEYGLGFDAKDFNHFREEDREAWWAGFEEALPDYQTNINELYIKLPTR